MKNIMLGVAPIAWSNDDLHELGGETSIESCLKDMQTIGYAGTEIGNKFPSSGLAIKTLLNEYNLVLASSWHSSFFLSSSFAEERVRLEARLKQLKEAGAQSINVCECTATVHSEMAQPLSKRPILAEKNWFAFSKNLSEAGKICTQNGINLNYHHHMGTVIQTESEVDRLLESTDPCHVFLCFDSGHLAFAGADPLSAWKKYSSRVRHIHLKDLRSEVLHNSKALDWSFLKSVVEGVFTVPSDGMIEFRPLLHAILHSDYSGWLLVEAEQDPAKADPFIYAKKAFSFLAHLVEYNLNT
jgi:inosose dehydratase